ncbi:MAG: hypothetical protein K2H74_02975 [Paramuribaculum sp.]|nr:hypothetical protein [Paramuribaculum sp.]
MDIVSRLKTFISYLTIPVTQFADNCTIARPTLSQLLNGRNKKVSDELIGKIHDAYPELSVLWLMFGEGDMLHHSATADTKPAEASIFDFDTDPITTTEEKETPRIDFNSYRDTDAEHPSTPTDAMYGDVTKFKAADTKADSPSGGKSPVESLAYNSDSRKKIVNIIVYYSDNSFESFVPNRQD